MNIYQKLIEVRKMVPYLQKTNKGSQYNYVGSSNVLGAVKEKMDELGLLLYPGVTGHNVIQQQRTNAKGNPNTTYFTEVDLVYTWVNADNPEETIVTPWYAQGVDIEGEKGVGKAYTYGEKYFLLKFFNIPTDKDDPDAFQRKNEEFTPDNVKAYEITFGKYAGKTLAEIHEENNTYTSWLAKNAKDEDTKKAAEMFLKLMENEKQQEPQQDMLSDGALQILTDTMAYYASAKEKDPSELINYYTTKFKVKNLTELTKDQADWIIGQLNKGLKAG